MGYRVNENWVQFRKYIWFLVPKGCWERRTKVEPTSRLTAVGHGQEMEASDRRRRGKTCLL